MMYVKFLILGFAALVFVSCSADYDGSNKKTGKFMDLYSKDRRDGKNRNNASIARSKGSHSTANRSSVSDKNYANSRNYRDGESYSDYKGFYKVGKPYQVLGQWYHPKEFSEYEKTGYASWYGEEFHGKSTANGEVFDMNEFTAAHRTLQLPCIVKVTNLDNNRSVVVRVNDRGPFKKEERIIDLSKAAASELGFVNNGLANVKVELMKKETEEFLKIHNLVANN